MVVGRLLSYWEGNFSVAMLNFKRVPVVRRLPFFFYSETSQSWLEDSFFSIFCQAFGDRSFIAPQKKHIKTQADGRRRFPGGEKNLC